MINIALALLSVALPFVHLSVFRQPWTRPNILRLLLLYAFVLDVGAIGFVFGFIPHVFFPDEAAQLIGWPKGSPFQFEVGIHDGAWGILGFLCLRFGGGFWLATGLGWSLFTLGATFGHVRETITQGDYAPYNFLTIFTDGFVALWLLGLLYAYYRCVGFGERAPREA